MEINEIVLNKMEPNHDQMVVFKVRDYVTELVGRFNQKNNVFYIQRGDGEIVAKYDFDRITEYRILEKKLKPI